MIGELLNEIALSGWLVNSLYQVDSGLWRCNLRKPDDNGDWFTKWVEGPTLEDVLWGSFEQTGAAEFTHTPETRTTIDKAPAASLLTRLGLVKPVVKIERRI